MEIFEQFKVDFISVTERFDTSTPSGRLLRNIMLTFAQFERELARERTIDKMLQRAAKGMWNGGLAPYGYKVVDKKLVPNKKESEIVRLIFETYYNTGSLAYTYDTLKEKDVRDRQGNYFSKSAIQYMVRNIVYTGKLKYSGKIYNGLHKPIISDELFNLAQGRHKEKIKKLRLNKSFLLAGLLSCQECGSAMTPSFSTKKSKKRYYYYRCTKTFKRDWDSCNTREINANRLERFIIENLKRISLDTAYLESLIFKLNFEHSGDRSGLELKPYKVENLVEMLKEFAQKIDTQDKIEHILLVRRTIKDIKYSPSTIQINLYYKPQNLVGNNLNNIACGRVRAPAGDSDFLPVSKNFGLTLKSKPSSLNHQGWLPREDSNLGPGGYKNPDITIRLGLYLLPRLPACRQLCYGRRVYSLCTFSAIKKLGGFSSELSQLFGTSLN
ncbi:MAG: recombinase family protein [Candidatus Omnitrophica bacterium]|nr:recombinase family protein [Candidatus Omnitrophota bacterium]